MKVNIYNLLILVGAVHGIVLSFLLLLSKRNRRIGNTLLALLLIFYTLPVLKSVVQDLGLFTLHAPWSWPIELLYGLGPSLYLYAKTVTDRNFALRRIDYLHFLPVLFELAYYAGPFYREPTTYGLTPPRDAQHVIWTVQQIGATLSVLIYLAMTHRLLRAYSRWTRENYSADHHRALRWLRIPVGLYTVFFGLWFSLRIVDVVAFADRLGSAPYYPLLLFLSISTYWIGTKGFLETQLPTAGFSSSDEGKDNEGSSGSRQYDNEDPILEQLFLRLEQSMDVTKLYRQNDLSLTDLAAHLDVNPRLLSKAINVKAEANFYDYVNRYRVDEFKQRVAEPGPRRTLLDLANDCGFGSKATFNTVFKKSTGMTPSQYRKTVRARETRS